MNLIVRPADPPLSEINLERMVKPRKLTPVEARQVDPLLRPDWRYDAVLRVLGQPGTRLKRTDDILIKTARSFIRDWRMDSKGQVRERLKLENNGLATAYQIFLNREKQPAFHIVLEARLLSRQPFSVIAANQPMLTEAVAWYEALFFNVRPRLKAHDWILRQVLLPAGARIGQKYDQTQEEPDVEFRDRDGELVPVRRVENFIQPHLDFTLPFFAYYGGPIVCEFMISGFQQGRAIQSPDELGSWLEEVYVRHIQRRSAQAAQVFKVNKYSAMELMSLHVQIIASAKKAADGGATVGEQRQIMEKLMKRLLGNLPWTSGIESQEVFEGTPQGDYDSQAIELSAQELMLLSGEDKIPEIDGLDDLIKRMESLQ
jgi:hypothetical protein